MHYQKNYECDTCGATSQTDYHYDNEGMECECGGTFRTAGEEYDSEFVEWEKYQHEKQRLDDRYNNR